MLSLIVALSIAVALSSDFSSGQSIRDKCSAQINFSSARCRLRLENHRPKMVTFSTIASAVKPSERSDQYLILGAMFCLNAHVEAVTAKQIKDLLELHLGKKAPANVNASLRAYDAYVEPAAKGPPLRWHLNPEGLQALREMSGLELAEKTDGNDFETDVGIVCALEQPEFEAIMNRDQSRSPWKTKRAEGCALARCRPHSPRSRRYISQGYRGT